MSLSKPCPFCGSRDIGIVAHSNARWFFAYCGNCGAEGPEESSKVKAALAWERRVGDEADIPASQRSNQK
ncbi:TPA: restriction alleviation protein, Lar family [Kluyvera intermedia]|nr:restriction alleviation protein, Lar family [Kluyvera intermedia]